MSYAICLVSKPLDFPIEAINTLINLTNFESITDLDSTTNDALVENIFVRVSRFASHEELAESVRFQRGWVQSNTFTDRLARDGRLLTTVQTAVKQIVGSGRKGERVKRQISNSQTLDEVEFHCYFELLS